jgi:integrase
VACLARPSQRLATNLYTLAVAPRIIQSILRHAAVETTTRHYVIIDESQNAAAMAELAEVITRKMETA